MNILKNIQAELDRPDNGLLAKNGKHIQADLSGPEKAPAVPGDGPGLGGIFRFGNVARLLRSPKLNDLIWALSGTSPGGGAQVAVTANSGIGVWEACEERVREAHALEEEEQEGSGEGGAQNRKIPMPSAPADRAERLVRAMVFAAKSDGKMDESGYQAIQERARCQGLGLQAERLIRQAMEKPLDPALVAQGVSSPEEALEIYVLSRIIAEPAQPEGRRYLDALAAVLRIPDDVRADIEAGMGPVTGGATH